MICIHVLLAAPADYAETTVTLIFDNVITRQCMNITIFDDATFESTENFFVELASTPFQFVSLSPDSAEVRILEDPTEG